jgi:hypothetical protein
MLFEPFFLENGFRSRSNKTNGGVISSRNAAVFKVDFELQCPLETSTQP